MLESIEKKLNLKLRGQYFVGDSMRDLQAAEAFGCKPVLVLTGKGKEPSWRITSLAMC